MASNHTNTAIYEGLGKPVSLEAIDGEIKKLWEEGADATERASLMNLAVYGESTEPQQLEENSALIARITQDHACRAILITAIPESSEASIQAWITAHCHLGSGGQKSICSEQIAFLIQGKHISQILQNTVFAHLESDLPLTFWWRGELGDRLHPKLYSRIDRLLFDSATWKDLPRQMAILQNILRDRLANFFLHDLNWTRTKSWRDAIAIAFDEPPLQKALPLLRSITIDHGQNFSTTAHLLATWFAVKIGKNVQVDSTTALTFKDDSKKLIPCTFRPTESSDPLEKITLDLSSHIVTISRRTDCQRIAIEITQSKKTHTLLHPYTGHDTYDLLRIELRRGGSHTLYRVILENWIKNTS